jgi:hypothetical protein
MSTRTTSIAAEWNFLYCPFVKGNSQGFTRKGKSGEKWIAHWTKKNKRGLEAQNERMKCRGVLFWARD